MLSEHNFSRCVRVGGARVCRGFSRPTVASYGIGVSKALSASFGPTRHQVKTHRGAAH